MPNWRQMSEPIRPCKPAPRSRGIGALAMVAVGRWLGPVLQLFIVIGVDSTTPPIPLIVCGLPAGGKPSCRTSPVAIKEILAPVSSSKVNGP